mgnify:CR=1 FL=1
MAGFASAEPIINSSFNLSINNVKINDVLNISFNLSDDVGLSTANITYNLSGILTKINFSLAGTSAQIYNVTRITDNGGSVINITGYVTDNSNNVVQNSTLITIANTEPNSTNIVNISGLYFNANQTFNITQSTDADSDTLTYFWFLNSSTDSYPNLVTNGTDKFSWITNVTDTNTYYLFVNVSDGVVNVSGDIFSFVYDPIAPVVNTSLNKSLTNITVNDIINITANVTDNIGLSIGQVIVNISGFKRYFNFSISGTEAQVSQNITINVTRGEVINFTIWVNDTAGNFKINDTIITVANTPPQTPTIVFPTTDLYTTIQPLDLNVSFAEDADGDTINISYYINGVLNQTSLTNTTLNVSDGYYILNVSISDGFAITENASVNFTVDTTAPIVNTSLNKSLSNITVNDIINITANVTDNIGLDAGQVIVNISGYNNYFNFTLSGTSAQISQNITINVTRGEVINFTIWVNDTAGNFKINDTIITVANTPPQTPTIVFPTTDLYTTIQPLDLNVSFAEDADGDTLNVSYYIDGVLNQTSLTNTTLNVSDGYYILNVSISDGFAITENASVNFTVDTTMPNVSAFSSPTNLSNITGLFVINVTVNDTTTNVDSVYFNITNGSNYVILTASNDLSIFWNASSNGNDLSEGEHNITVYANDTLGNLNNEIFNTITVDNVVPSVVILSPSNNINVSEDVNITVTAMDTVGIQAATVWNGSGWSSLSLIEGSINNGNWSIVINTIALSDGLINFTINATDFNGNFNDSEYVNVTVDNTNAKIYQFNGNVVGNASVKGTIVINATSNDTSGVGVDNLTFTINSVNYVAEKNNDYWNLTFSTTGLSDGRYNITAIATDYAGNDGVDHVVISEVMFDGPGLDSSIENEWVELYNPTNSSVNLTGWDLRDEGGSVYDITSIIIISPRSTIIIAENATYFNQTYGINATVQDDTFSMTDSTGNLTLRDSNNDAIDFTAWGNSASWNIDANAGNTTTRNPVSGDINSPNDFSNNTLPTPGSVTNPEFITITVDNTPPNVVQFNNMVVDGANLSSSSYTINTTVNDTTLSVDNVYFFIVNSSSDNIQNITASNDAGDYWNATWSTTSLTDGQYNITVYANDTLGNLNSSEKISVNVDTTVPSMVVVKPLNNTFVNNGRQEVGFNITDAVSGVNASTLTSSSFRYAFSSFAFDISDIALNAITNGYYVNGTVDLGSNEVQVNVSITDAKDNSGNSISAFWTYTIDLTLPKVTNIDVVNDTDKKVRSTDVINITLNATNGAAGIDNVSISNGSSIVYMSPLSGDIWQGIFSASAMGCNGDGNCTLIFNATDTAGNKNNSEALNITIDNTKPKLFNIILDDLDKKVKSSDNIQVNITVNDTNFDSGSAVALGNFSVVSMVKDSTANDSSIWTVTTTASALGCNATNGACILGFNATDIVGNINSSETLTMTVDDTSPTVVSPNTNDSNNIVRNDTYLNITINATDTNTIKNVTLNGTVLTGAISGDIWHTVNYTYQLCPGLTNGACTLTYTVYDNVSNANNSETLTIFVDHTNPSFVDTNTSDSDNIVGSTDMINFTANITDTYNVSAVDVNGTVMAQIINTSVWYVTSNASEFGCTTDGNCTLLFNATDNAGNKNNQTLTITVDTTAPTFNNITRSLITIYNTLNVTVSTVWNDTNGIASVVFEHNATNGSFVNYTATNDNGNYSLIINGSILENQEVVAWKSYATDTAGRENNSMNLQTFSVSNRIPSSSTLPSVNWSQNTNATLNLSQYFTDLDSDNLSYVVVSSPQNITILIDNNTDVATFVPDADFNYKLHGIRNATFNATDGYSWNNSNMIMLNVSFTNTYAPVVSGIPDVTFAEDGHNATINLSNYVTDRDNFDYEINWTAFGNSSVVIKINQTTKIVNISAVADFTGFENVIFSANDGNFTGTDVMKVTVTAVNDAPTVPTQIYPANNSNVTLTNLTLNWNGSTDAEGDAITYYVFFSNSSNPLFNTTTAENNTNISDIVKGKTYYWYLIASDGTSNSSNSSLFQFTASNNNVPTFSGPIPNMTWPEDVSNSSLNLSVYFTDNDVGDTLTYSSTTPTNITVSISQSTGVVTLTPAGNFTGIAYINFSASDGTNTTWSNSTQTSIKLNVTNVNDGPVLTAIGSLSATQATSFYYDVNATDVDSGDSLTFSDNSSLFTIAANGTFNFTPTNAQVGTHSINISVNDSAGLLDSEIISLTISDTNDAPVMDTISSQSATEDSELRFNITTNDPDNNTLTYSSNVSVSFTNSANRSLTTASWTPTNSYVGSAIVNISVSDGSLTDSQLVTITVTNTNDAPTIDSYSPLTNPTIASQAGSQRFEITFSDVDVGDSYNAAWYRNGTIIASSSLNASNVTVTGLNTGIYNVSAVVTDSAGNSTQQEWILTASGDINSTELTSPVLDLNETERQSVTNVAVNQSVSGGIDFGSNTLNFSGVVALEDAFNISEGMVSVDTDTYPGLNKSASLSMKSLNFTKAPLIYMASGFESTANANICPSTICTNINYDPSTGVLRFDVAHFTTFFTQQNTTNGAPIITSTAKTSSIVDEQYSYDVDATDPDGDTLTYSLTTSPTGMSISSSSGLITYTPSATGNFSVTVQASDGSLTDSQSYNLIVGKASKLRITDLDVKVSGKTKKDLDNNTKIKKDAEPGDELEFIFKVENFFTDDEDLEIEDIEVEITIQDIDDGDDLEEDADEFDLDAGKDEKVKIKFDVPLEVDEDTYDVIIDVEGEDENGTAYNIRWELELDVDKEKHEIRILRASLTPTTIKCQRTVSINTELINTGSEDEDDVTLEVLNGELGINSITTGELDEGTDDNRMNKLVTASINSDAVSGIYPITVNAYYGSNLAESKTLNLEVQECELVKEVKKEVRAEVKEEKPRVEVIIPEPKVEEKPEAPIEISFTDTDEYLTLLAILIVIFLGTVIFVVGAAFIVLRK